MTGESQQKPGGIEFEENLSRLCDSYGILTGYYSADGDPVEISPEVCRELIAAQKPIVAAQKPSQEGWWASTIIVPEAETPLWIPLANQKSLPPIHQEQYAVEIILEGGGVRKLEAHLSQAPDSRYALRVPASLPAGYHRLLVHSELHAGEVELIVSPDQCYVPPEFDSSKFTGLSVQLYALRSERNYGIGDFADLYRFIEMAHSEQLKVVGVNPIHALMPGNPDMISPYYPSSRLWLNWLYIAPEWVAEWKECQVMGMELPERPLPSDSSRIDYERVIETKMSLYRQLFEVFYHTHYGKLDDRGIRFQQFVDAGGESLYNQAVFDALYQEMVREIPGAGGADSWPLGYQNCHSSEIQQFARKHSYEILFFQYLQWIAREQLDYVGERSSELGVSLYLDLAVGAAPGGAEVWSNPENYTNGATIGAPPDHFAPLGQDWGLAPIIPDRLEKKGYKPFIDMVRSNMIPGGILRIDHIMALFRLYWVTGPGRGGYVHYPAHELLSILALESRRNRCMVIGEDLGTVPPEVREQMRRRKIHTWKVLYFEREGSEFRDPKDYEDGSVATVNTHDLPTLVGFWKGADLDLKRTLQLIDESVYEKLQGERNEDRQAMQRALESCGLWPEGRTVETLSNDELIEAVHLYLARAGSRMVLLSIHDLMGDERQPNLPGTNTEYPNWSLTYPVDLSRFDLKGLSGHIGRLRMANGMG